MFSAPQATAANPNPPPVVTAVAQFATGIPAGPVDLQVTPAGEILFVTYQPGAVYRVVPLASVSVNMTATPFFGPLPLTIQFGTTVNATNGPVTYSWDLDGDGVFGDSVAAAPIWTYTVAAMLTVTVRVENAVGFMNVATFVVHPGNTPPSGSIDSPDFSFAWSSGVTVAFNGSGTDREDGTLAASMLSWALQIQTCSGCAFSTLASANATSSGSFTGALPRRLAPAVVMCLTLCARQRPPT
jgi:hypothetical protein